MSGITQGERRALEKIVACHEEASNAGTVTREDNGGWGRYIMDLPDGRQATCGWHEAEPDADPHLLWTQPDVQPASLIDVQIAAYREKMTGASATEVKRLQFAIDALEELRKGLVTA